MMKHFLLLILILTGAGRMMAQTVSDLTPSGTGIKWYSVSTGGTLYTGSEALVNGQHYYASQTTAGGIESSSRLDVTATVVTTPVPPTTATHTPTQIQIIWNWNTVSGASGYKWNTTDNSGTATDMATAVTKTETGLNCGLSYTRYIWAYTSNCVSATATTLMQNTVACVSAPSVTTSAATAVGSTTATFNADITATGGAAVTTRGFKYSTQNNFDPANTGTNISESVGYSTGAFSLSPSGLNSTTTYYVVAYATNSAGTTYGAQVSFTTIVYNTWTFTNASATGSAGPSQSQVNSAYSGTSLAGGVTISTQGIQEWIVPVTGQYSIRAKGAQGARSGGLGADMTGTFSLTQGETIKIVVGQTGVDGVSVNYLGGGGGGGSFVIRTSYTSLASVLVIAGGGGGYTDYGTTTTMNAFSTTSGGSTYNSGGGTSGNGGGSGQDGDAAGGGGLLTDGANGNTAPFSYGGMAFVNGANGGTEGHDNILYNGGNGGFGGGGGGWSNVYNRSGGGGGYSGGQGGGWIGQPSGGGGGSYNAGTSQSNTAGSNSGHGQVIITKL